MSDLARAVEVLGACADARAVADLLVAVDARGVRHSLSDCPVAVYLRRRVSYKVRVIGDNVIGVLDAGRVELMFLPETVQEFVARFDAGGFAELRRPVTHRPNAV